MRVTAPLSSSIHRIARGLALSAAVAAFGCTPERPSAPETAEQVARAVVQGLAVGDLGKVAERVHHEAGLRFSPYGYVELDRGQVLSREELKVAWGSDSRRQWGSYDGTGESIELTPREYFERFVYDADFATTAQVSVDRRIGTGNSIDNIREVFPEATIVEFYVPGVDPQYRGMDWRSLRVVLVEEDGVWWLLGLVHDEWTI